MFANICTWAYARAAVSDVYGPDLQELLTEAEAGVVRGETDPAILRW